MTTGAAEGKAVHSCRQDIWDDPVQWMADVLGVQLWARQAEIAEAVRDNPHVAVRSANAVGKSFLAACLTVWYLETQRPAYVVTTSSSWRGVQRVLWPEIRRAVRNARTELGGTLLRTEWRRDEKWGAFGVSADTPENFAGFRTSHGAFVIVDEASAIEPEIYEAIMGLTATGGSRVLMIGNPLRPSGSFYDAFRSDAWAHLHISALECPNVVEGRGVIPGLATRRWVEERKGEWGESSPAYQARVLGEFPEAGEDVLVPLHWVEAALAREAEPTGALRMGVDVARFGGDRTALLVRDEGAVRHLEWHTKEDTMTTAGRVLSTARERLIKARDIFVDDAGLGGGVTDRLRELGIAVTRVNFGERAIEPDRFANLRAESYWSLREALDPNGPTPLAIPRAYKAIAYECGMPRIGYTSRGQVKLESKDDIRKRLGRSPDLADALALTYAAPEPDIWVGG